MNQSTENPQQPNLPQPKLDPAIHSKELAEISLATAFEGLLKRPYDLIKTMQNQTHTKKLVLTLSLISAVGILIFGITLGSFSLQEQIWAAPLKSIFGLGFSAFICLPSLYIFTALTGTSLRLNEIITGLTATLALIAALLLGFTPVLWVFSQSSDSEVFFGTLTLIVWIISFFFGTGILTKMLDHSGTTKRGPLKIWVGIFLLVTLQMSTSLRPIIGTSDKLFTSEKRFFLTHWVMQLDSPRKPDSPRNDSQSR